MKNKKLNSKFFYGVVVVSMALLLEACTIIPQRLSDQAQAQQASRDRKAFYIGVEPIKQQLTLADAIARAIKYNLDHNLKIMEESLALGQLRLSEQGMLPKLAVRAGYTNRNKPSGASSISLVSGAQSLEASSSAQRESVEADLTVAWNVLDFGLSYLRANQQADRLLVAEERRRKVVHDIIQEVRQAFWRAVAAQRLLPKITTFLAEAHLALADSKKAEQQLLEDPLKALEYQMGLLETIYQITTLQRDLSVARTQLTALINLDPNSALTLSAPTDAERQIPLFSYGIETMENMAMTLRPELREEEYQKRIDATETRLAILQMIPGLGFSSGYNISTNRLLYHQNWLQGSMQMAWNLVNIVKAPTIFSMAEAREKVTQARRLSMGMAVLTQVHVAKIRYDQTLEEYKLLSQMSDIAKRVHNHTGHAKTLQTKTDLQRIQSKARAVYRHLQKELAYAELHNAAGRLYLSIGVDPLPDTLESHNLADLSKILDIALQHWGSEFQDIAKQVNTDTDAFSEMPESYNLDMLSKTLDATYHYWRSEDIKALHAIPLPAERLPNDANESTPVNTDEKSTTVDTDEKSTTVDTDEKPTTVDTDEKPTTVDTDEKPTTVDTDKKPTTVDTDKKPTTINEDENSLSKSPAQPLLQLQPLKQTTEQLPTKDKESTP